MTERTYGSNTTVVTEYQLKPNNIPFQIKFLLYNEDKNFYSNIQQ